MLQFILTILIILFPVILGFIFGKIAETKHIKSILKREQKLATLPWRNTGKKETFHDTQGVLVTGSVVVAQDAFKAFLAAIAFIFGGRVTPYESLMERARREAILRLKEKAYALGAKEIIHLRMETSTIAFSEQTQGKGAVEVFCYATALFPAKS